MALCQNKRVVFGSFWILNQSLTDVVLANVLRVAQVVHLKKGITLLLWDFRAFDQAVHNVVCSVFVLITRAIDPTLELLHEESEQMFLEWLFQPKKLKPFRIFGNCPV